MEGGVESAVLAKGSIIPVFRKPARNWKMTAVESDCADRSPGTRSVCGKSSAW